MKCRLCHLSGLGVSALVHAAVASAWLLSQGGKDIVTQQPLPLQLAMFAEQPVSAVETVAAPKAEPLPEITTPPEPLAIPEPEFTPPPEPGAAPEPEITLPAKPVVESGPEEQPEPEPKIKPKPQPRIARLPEPASVKPTLKVKPKPRPVASLEPPEPVAETPPQPPASARSPEPPQSVPVQPIQTPRAVANATPAKPAPDAEILAQQEHNYRLEIIKRIESNKFFPRRARKMRQTGDVIVEFTLMRDGSLSEAKVLQSSAPPILEKAALKAIQVSALFPPFPEIITRDSWSFQTSLEYRLR